MSKKNVFVYGSLKRGFYNEHFLKNAKLISKDAITQRKYELYPSADYLFPYLSYIRLMFMSFIENQLEPANFKPAYGIY